MSAAVSAVCPCHHTSTSRAASRHRSHHQAAACRRHPAVQPLEAVVPQVARAAAAASPSHHRPCSVPTVRQAVHPVVFRSQAQQAACRFPSRPSLCQASPAHHHPTSPASLRVCRFLCPASPASLRSRRRSLCKARVLAGHRCRDRLVATGDDGSQVSNAFFFSICVMFQSCYTILSRHFCLFFLSLRLLCTYNRSITLVSRGDRSANRQSWRYGNLKLGGYGRKLYLIINTLINCNFRQGSILYSSSDLWETIGLKKKERK